MTRLQNPITKRSALGGTTTRIPKSALPVLLGIAGVITAVNTSLLPNSMEHLRKDVSYVAKHSLQRPTHSISAALDTVRYGGSKYKIVEYKGANQDILRVAGENQDLAQLIRDFNNLAPGTELIVPGDMIPLSNPDGLTIHDWYDVMAQSSRSPSQ